MDSLYWIRDSLSLELGILDSNFQWNSGFLKLYSEFQSLGFRLYKQKISRIPDSASGNSWIPESGFPVTWVESVLSNVLRFQPAKTSVSPSLREKGTGKGKGKGTGKGKGEFGNFGSRSFFAPKLGQMETLATQARFLQAIAKKPHILLTLRPSLFFSFTRFLILDRLVGLKKYISMPKMCAIPKLVSAP